MGRCEKRSYLARGPSHSGSDAFHRVVRTGFTPSRINPRDVRPPKGKVSGSQARPSASPDRRFVPSSATREQMGRCEKRPYHARDGLLSGRDAFRRMVRTGFTPSLINPRDVRPTKDVISGSQERRGLSHTGVSFHRTPPGNEWDAVKSVFTTREDRPTPIGTRPAASVSNLR